MLWKKKEFEDLEEDLLVSFGRLYFIIAGDNLYISTMYYLNICSTSTFARALQRLIMQST
jgi:hypothetical protein